jgi:hypothetical protein
LCDDIRWMLHDLLPRIQQELPCGAMSREDANRLTAAESNRQKTIARYLISM